MEKESASKVAKALVAKRESRRGPSAREVALDVVLELDLRQEQASSLGRTGRRIERALRQMRAAAEAWRADGNPEHARTFDEARRKARQYRWELVVQREAMGLTDHTAVHQAYPIPQNLLDG